MKLNFNISKHFSKKEINVVVVIYKIKYIYKNTFIKLINFS